MAITKTSKGNRPRIVKVNYLTAVPLMEITQGAIGNDKIYNVEYFQSYGKGFGFVVHVGDESVSVDPLKPGKQGIHELNNKKFDYFRYPSKRMDVDGKMKIVSLVDTTKVEIRIERHMMTVEIGNNHYISSEYRVPFEADLFERRF
jgi:hypothetical protein